MSGLPPNFQENLRIIQTLRSLPGTGCRPGGCGYTCQEILDQHNALFPATPFTLTQVCNLLQAGARRGLYNKGGCPQGQILVPGSTTCAPIRTADNGVENQLFYINTAMASRNPQNGAYVAVGYKPDPNQPRLGYLPCSKIECVGGGGYGYNPYSSSSSNRTWTSLSTGGVAGPGGNAGTPTVGEGCLNNGVGFPGAATCNGTFYCASG